MSLVATVIVHGHQAGVIQSRHRLSLTPEPLHEHRIGSQASTHDLDRHLAVQPVIKTPIHGRHSAGRDRFHDLVPVGQVAAPDRSGRTAQGPVSSRGHLRLRVRPTTIAPQSAGDR